MLLFSDISGYMEKLFNSYDESHILKQRRDEFYKTVIVPVVSSTAFVDKQLNIVHVINSKIFHGRGDVVSRRNAKSKTHTEVRKTNLYESVQENIQLRRLFGKYMTVRIFPVYLTSDVTMDGTNDDDINILFKEFLAHCAAHYEIRLDPSSIQESRIAFVDGEAMFRRFMTETNGNCVCLGDGELHWSMNVMRYNGIPRVSDELSPLLWIGIGSGASALGQNTILSVIWCKHAPDSCDDVGSAMPKAHRKESAKGTWWSTCEGMGGQIRDYYSLCNFDGLTHFPGVVVTHFSNSVKDRVSSAISEYFQLYGFRNDSFLVLCDSELVVQGKWFEENGTAVRLPSDTSTFDMLGARQLTFTMNLRNDTNR